MSGTFWIGVAVSFVAILVAIAFVMRALRELLPPELFGDHDNDDEPVDSSGMFRCECCKRLRHTSKISVVSRDFVCSGGIQGSRHVNHCNDMAECRIRARELADAWVEKMSAEDR